MYIHLGVPVLYTFINTDDGVHQSLKQAMIQTDPANVTELMKTCLGYMFDVFMLQL